MSESHEDSLVSVSDNAEHYTVEEAERLFVPPPFAALPKPAGHWVVVGPRGAGKTHLLKSLTARWSRDSHLLPVYVDLGRGRWVASVASELPGESQTRLSPRDKATMECMSIAVAHTILSRVSESAPQVDFETAFRLLNEDTATFKEWERRAAKRVQALMATGMGARAVLPDMSVLAHELGTLVKHGTGQRLILLIDQLDNVTGVLLHPILELLRRASGYSAIIASRPCPAAPHSITAPVGVNPSDTFKIIIIGREGDQKRRVSQIGEVYAKLAKASDLAASEASRTAAELQPFIEVIAALTWPTIRYAIGLFVEYHDRRMAGNSELDSFAGAIREMQADCQTNAEDRISAWCPNPSRLIREWRLRVQDKSSGKQIRGSFTIDRQHVEEGLPMSAQAFLRSALKAGILTSDGNGTYLGDRLPEKYDIATLLTVPQDRIPSMSSLKSAVEWQVMPSEIASWATHQHKSPPRAPQVAFVSLYTSEPGFRQVADSDLYQALATGLGNDVRLTSQDDIGGSVYTATELMKLIRESQLLICDLTVPRREIFLEFGWAIGNLRPVVLVTRTKADRPSNSPWLIGQQFHQYDTDSNRRAMCRAAAQLLNNPSQPSRTWQTAPDASYVDVEAVPERMLFLGTRSGLAEAETDFSAILTNVGLKPEFLDIDPSSSHELYRVIKATHASSTLVLLSTEDSEADDMQSIAGGVFTSRPAISLHGNRLPRQVIVLDEALQQSRSAGLLRQVPDVLRASSRTHLRELIQKRAVALHSWRRRVAPARRSR